MVNVKAITAVSAAQMVPAASAMRQPTETDAPEVYEYDIQNQREIPTRTPTTPNTDMLCPTDDWTSRMMQSDMDQEQTSPFGNLSLMNSD